MPYELKINDESLYIENIVSGSLSRSDLEKNTAEATALQKNHGIYSVLINALDLESVESVTDVYELPKQYVDHGVSRSSRIAMVMPKLESARKISRFYENVCINRGWTVRSFETKGEAERWLESKRP